MDTKWKKWKNRIAVGLFFAGSSLLVLALVVICRQFLEQKNRNGEYSINTNKDYQEQDAFKEYMTQKMDSCLEIANGTFINWDYGYYGNSDYDTSSEATSSVSTSGTYSEQTTEDSVAYENDVPIQNQQEYEQALERARESLDYNLPDLSDADKKTMAESYLKYESKDKNVLYQISSNGEVLYTNMTEPYCYGEKLPDNYNYLMYFDGEKVRVQKDGKEIDIYGDGIYSEDDDYSVPGYKNYSVDESLKNVTVTLLAIKKPMEYRIAGSKTDSYYCGNTYSIYCDMIKMNNDCRDAFYASLIGLFLLIAAIILLWKEKEHKNKLAGVLNHIWIEIKVIVILFFVYLGIHSFFMIKNDYGYLQEMQYYLMERESYAKGIYDLEIGYLCLIFRNPILTVFYFWLIFLLVFDLISNHKKPINGLIPNILRGFYDKSLNMKFTKKQMRKNSIMLIGLLISFLLCMIGYFSLFQAGKEVTLIYPIAGGILFLITAIWYSNSIRSQVNDLELLNTQIACISGGNYEPEKMICTGDDFKETEENLLHIQNGIKTAVEEQLKSERMKVDLVANVSHDLKTPLTSIISYIQFLKEEDTLPEHVKDYVRILDEKSIRLNEMVQDVFSISKATSGQLPVQLEILDFGKLLNQTLADMDEAIAKSSIQIKVDVEEHSLYIEADGQRMYRVCQNLIQNALKYSLDGSRMYLSLKSVDHQAVATFMNTSKEELDQNTDFSARFVRGDKSRTDGGSGLGLSIAQSFTQACGGRFNITTNGDMFIATLTFEQRIPDEKWNESL